MLARQADGSTGTLESDFKQVCQPSAPQVTQIWYKKAGNFWLQLWDSYLLDLLIKKSAWESRNLWYLHVNRSVSVPCIWLKYAMMKYQKIFFAFFEIKYMKTNFFFFSIYRMEYDTNASIQKKEL